MCTRRPAHQPARGTAAPRGFVSPWEHGSRLYRTLVLTGSALFLVGIVLAVVGGSTGRLAVSGTALGVLGAGVAVHLSAQLARFRQAARRQGERRPGR
ncbi:hypothetical protein M3E78_003770 [Micrococcus luteus]|nr:hypothetical protein [Micrococcus luteus]MCV7573082.1 hypothetical protein [Micrococcus luteus]